MTQSNSFRPSWAAPLAQSPEAALDPIARAEAALKALAGQFSVWLQDEIGKLDAARARAADDGGLGGAAGEALYIHAHDLKGLGGTYGFPIISRIAGSLCDLLEDAHLRANLPMVLVDAHLDAIKTMVRDDVRDELHPMGGAMTAALENQVRAAVG